MNPLFPKLLLSFLAAFVVFSCQAPLFPDDDSPADKADWRLLELPAERQILGLHATPFQLYAITDNQFFRFNTEDEMVELRTLNEYNGVKGVPALNDNAFMRLVLNEDNRQVLEFQHARNAQSFVNILVDSLEKDAGTFLEVEFVSRQLGAFSSDGSSFLLPVKVFPQRHYAFYLFEIQQNTPSSAFVSVKPVKRISIPELDAELNNLKSVRFLNGNYYIASSLGAWRITPAGQAQQVFPQWMLDFFSLKGKLYATGLNPYDLHNSTDNGLNWERIDQSSQVKYAETADTLLFSQEVLGNPYKIVSGDFKIARDIARPAEAPTNPSVFYSVVFFAGRYYFSMDRDVYSAATVVIE
jgi:hypothetical protein